MAIKIKADLKNRNGKGAARALRREGKIPAIVYGGAHGEVAMSVPAEGFMHAYNRGNITSKLFELEYNGEHITAIPKSVQLDPVTDYPVHVDFQEVDKDTVIKASVYVRIVNEDKSPGLKKGGMLNVAHRYITIHCHPLDIPECFIVDVTGLDIGGSIHINDLKLPSVISTADKSNFVVASIAGRGASARAEQAAAEGAAASA